MFILKLYLSELAPAADATAPPPAMVVVFAGIYSKKDGGLPLLLAKRRTAL